MAKIVLHNTVHTGLVKQVIFAGTREIYSQCTMQECPNMQQPSMACAISSSWCMILPGFKPKCTKMLEATLMTVAPLSVYFVAKIHLQIHLVNQKPRHTNEKQAIGLLGIAECRVAFPT